MEDGTIITDKEQVMDKWKTDYEKLYNGGDNTNEFDSQQNMFPEINYVIRTNNHDLDMTILNEPISVQEIELVITRAKVRKASGIDDIPREVLKNATCVNLLHTICSYCFEHGEIPTEWTKSIVKPIPNPNTKDNTDPLNYRGIALISVPGKILLMF